MSVVGMTTAYDLTVGVVVNMDEAIYMISPIDSPLISGLASDGLSVLSTSPVDEIQYFWLEEEILTPRSSLNGAVTTGDTFITLATGERLRFSTGDLIKIVKAGGTEFLRVTGLGSTAETLTVTRAYAGTATNYASAAVVIGVGLTLAEGSNPENSRQRDRTQVDNYTQIFGPTKITMSRTEQNVRKYGVANEYTKQLYNRVSENVIAREQALLYGTKTNSTTTKIRSMGGIDYFITSNVDSTNTQLTILTIQSNQQTCYNAGSLPDRFLVNPQSLLDLNATNDTARVRQYLDDPKRGRVPTMEAWTEFGPLSIVRNRWVHPFHAFAIKRDSCIRRIFAGMQLTRLAKTGDSDETMLVCEEGFELKGQRHMFKMTALSY